jgi:hypothetical protein
MSSQHAEVIAKSKGVYHRRIVALMAALLLIVVAVPALAAVTTGDRINLFFGDTSFPEGEPFYISHGFARVTDTSISPWDFVLEVDGVEVADRGVTVTFREDGSLQAARVYNFPDGMKGTHTFDGYWYQTCRTAPSECDPGARPGDVYQVLHLSIEVTFDGS